MNEFEKAYGELWSVLHNEPATEIEKKHREHIKRLETLKPLINRTIPMKPYGDNGVTILPFAYYCSKCNTELSDGGYKGDGKFCPDCGQAIDWSE